jgi:hypothetical protein
MNWEGLRRAVELEWMEHVESNTPTPASLAAFYRMLPVVEAAAGLADILDDRVHRHLSANEKHWHGNLKKAIEDLEGEE